VSVAVSHFEPCRPKVWNGRYSRIPGDTSVFHLHSIGGRLWPVILWDVEDDRGTCKAVACEAIEPLVKAVVAAKRLSGGSAGSFIINEFGQVIVPSDDTRYLVGCLKKLPLFENPFLPEEPVDLVDTSYLQSGDPWKLPYVGVPYNLHRSSKIYFYQIDGDGGRSIDAPKQDVGLIKAIRAIRPNGPVRFIVNPAGLVLTKQDNGLGSEESWQPVFVGSIAPSLWFEQE
jgi:hypothetical protein